MELENKKYHTGILKKSDSCMYAVAYDRYSLVGGLLRGDSVLGMIIYYLETGEKGCLEEKLEEQQLDYEIIYDDAELVGILIYRIGIKNQVHSLIKKNQVLLMKARTTLLLSEKYHIKDRDFLLDSIRRSGLTKGCIVYFACVNTISSAIKTFLLRIGKVQEDICIIGEMSGCTVYGYYTVKSAVEAYDQYVEFLNVGDYIDNGLVLLMVAVELKDSSILFASYQAEKNMNILLGGKKNNSEFVSVMKQPEEEMQVTYVVEDGK